MQTVNDLAVIFGEVPDPVQRARAGQAEEVDSHLFRRLQGLPLPLFRSGSPVVIVTDEMSVFDATRPGDYKVGIMSAKAPRIPEVKKTILTVDSEEARHMARSVLALEDADQVKACLRREAGK